MNGIVRGLLRLPCLVLQKPPCRFKLDAKSMNDKLKFEFTEENLCRAKSLLSNYEKGEKRGALLPLLDLAQRQYGWLPITAIKAVADMIKVDPFEAWEVAYFYTMFHLQPVGKYYVKVCTSTPCYLRGSDVILKACQDILELKDGETSKDMQFTLSSGPCFGACVNAPVMGVNDDTFEDLTVPDVKKILCSLFNGKVPAAGPYSGRFSCEPKCGPTTLLMDPPPAGYGMQDLCQVQKKKP